MMVIQSCILTINVRALKKWTGRVRQVTVRFRKIHSFSKFWWYIQGVWYSTIFKVLGEHISSSIQCVSWKFSVWKGVDGQKALSWENLRFPGFLFIGVRSKISMSIALNQYFFLWVWVSQMTSWVSWKVGFSERSGGGRGEPDLKLVRWRQSGLLRPAQTQTSHMCPDPGSQYGLLEKPTHQGLCNQEEQLWGPQSQTPIQPPSHTTPPLLWAPLAETCFLCSQGNLSKHIYSLVLTLISALMRTHSADFKLGKRRPGVQKPFWWQHFALTVPMRVGVTNFLLLVAATHPQLLVHSCSHFYRPVFPAKNPHKFFWTQFRIKIPIKVFTTQLRLQL